MSGPNGDAKRQCVRDNFSFPTNVLEAVIDSSLTEQLSNSGTLSYRPRKRNLDSKLSNNVTNVNQNLSSIRRTTRDRYRCDNVSTSNSFPQANADPSIIPTGTSANDMHHTSVNIAVPGFGIKNVSKIVQGVHGLNTIGVVWRVLYIYDTENEVDNRMRHFGADDSGIRRDIVEGLIELLDNHNALVQLFKTTHEKLLDSDIPPFKVKLYSVVGAREYELPTGDMLGAIVYEPGPEAEMDYDIIIEERDGQPQRVNKLHPSYMSL
ncbi:hypothetical protein Tco_1334293 [Tanacetum coccineum]